MKLKNFSERGQALIIFALAAIGLFGIVGLAIDGSAKFSDRRHAQNAADTAAMAGALAKVNALTNKISDNSPTTGSPTTCPPPSGVLPSPVCEALQLAGLNRALSNGYNNNLVSNTVEVYSPPISGPYSGNSEYVQVIITSHVNTTFSRVVGIQQTHNTVQAVALTKEGGILGDGAMIIAYDPDPICSTGGTGGDSVSVSGSSTVNLNGGGIFLNSQDTCGFVIPNCADLNIYGGSIDSVGDNIDLGTCTFEPSITTNINQDPVIIPDDVYWPPVPPECSQTPQSPSQLGTVVIDGKSTGEWLIYPGYYESFPPSDLVGNKQSIYMHSGVYCIDPGGPTKDFDLSWSPVDFVSLNGSTQPLKNKYHAYNPNGVTLYIKKGGGFSINANNPTLLDATTSSSSDYQGYLIILEGTRTSIEACSITGGADLDINGMIFSPYCDITVNGGSEPKAEINAQLLGWTIKINGTTTINFNYNPDNLVKIKRKVGLMR
jgi:Tfp pilus assembly protein PilX